MNLVASQHLCPKPVFAASELSYESAPPPRTLRDQLRDSMGGQEWEAVVGGSWLNKLGVLVLVIGIALLLGYEFTRVGPAGRVAIGMGVSLTMLIGGVLHRTQARLCDLRAWADRRRLGGALLHHLCHARAARGEGDRQPLHRYRAPVGRRLRNDSRIRCATNRKPSVGWPTSSRSLRWR